MDSREYFELLKDIAAQGRECHMVVTGNSMAPFLCHERDTVYFKKAPDRLKTGDIVFFQRTNGQFVMHRICRVVQTQNKTNGRPAFYLTGDNQTEIEGPVYPEQIFAKITKVKRKGNFSDPHSFDWFFFAHTRSHMTRIRRPLMQLYRKLASFFK